MNYPEDFDFEQLLPDDYKQVLDSDMVKRTSHRLNAALDKARTERRKVYPFPENLLTALTKCKLEDIKVVILAQDPYHSNDRQANGIAFSVPDGVAIPPSLRNIFKELDNCYNRKDTVRTGNLLNWVEQGVLLLNASLSVTQGQPGSHMQVWEEFTNNLLVSLQARGKIVFCLWGKFAIEKENIVSNISNIVLKSSHPSPLSAAKTDTPFLGSNVFVNVNTALESLRKDRIQW